MELVKKESLKEARDIYSTIVDKLGLGCFSPEDARPLVYRDQDGGKHLIFVKETIGNLEVEKSKEVMNKKQKFYHDFYNNGYLTGTTCLTRSRLVRQHLQELKDLELEGCEISMMTVASAIDVRCYYSEMGVVSAVMQWVYCGWGCI